MTKTTNPLRLALEDALGAAGFSRKGDSWFRTTDDVVEVVNLQKSQYASRYFLNYGLWLRALGAERFPREEKCHVRMRGGAMVKSETRLDELLDLEFRVSEPERRVELATLIRSEFLTFAEDCRTLDGLRSQLERGSLTRAMVHVRAREVLIQSDRT